MNEPKTRLINCPQCGKPSRWSTDNRYRPFCSERCRLIDLGAWANESYCVPQEETQPDDELPPPITGNS